MFEYKQHKQNKKEARYLMKTMEEGLMNFLKLKQIKEVCVEYRAGKMDDLWSLI